MADRNLHPVMQAAIAPFMPEANPPKIGDLRIAPYSQYEPGASGYVIEEYWTSAIGWVIGNYEETGEGSLAGVFATHDAARRALRGSV